MVPSNAVAEQREHCKRCEVSGKSTAMVRGGYEVIRLPPTGAAIEFLESPPARARPRRVQFCGYIGIKLSALLLFARLVRHNVSRESKSLLAANLARDDSDRRKTMLQRATAAVALMGLATLAHADDIDLNQLLGVQGDFRVLSEDLGSALSYKPVAPGEPLGLLGIDVGVELTATDLEGSRIYQRATGSSDNSDYLLVPKLHVHKGLPLRLNVDAFYSTVPDSNIELFGGAIGFALLEGGVATPALTVRATASKLSGVDSLDLDTQGVELTISKGFAIFTPYAGIGRVHVSSEPNGIAALALRKESFDLDKFYAGLNINLGLLNFAFEADQTGDAASYSGKLGFRF
jgi:hypothetical protein